MEFKNQYIFNRQAIEILTSSLKICKKTFFESAEYEISFEKLDNKIKIRTTVRNGLFMIAFFFTVIGLLLLTGTDSNLTGTFFILAISFFAISFLTKKKTITIASYDGDDIILYFTKRNKEKVINFAQQIIKSGNNFLLNKYGKIDKALPIENQLANLDFLRNKEIITEDHFENLKNQLLGRENKSSIGFSH